MAKVWFQANDASLGSRELNWGVTRIGRARDNHLVIDHPSISTFHCEFVLGLDTLIIRDVGSTNGTYVDGTQVREAPLKPGQTLRFGEIEGKVYFSQDPVRVPEIPIPFNKRSIPFDDGTVSCLNHPDVRATRHCPRCARVFCNDCIHSLKFRGSIKHYFCPHCSTETEAIRWGDEEAHDQSLWQRIKKLWSGHRP